MNITRILLLRAFLLITLLILFVCLTYGTEGRPSVVHIARNVVWNDFISQINFLPDDSPQDSFDKELLVVQKFLKAHETEVSLEIFAPISSNSQWSSDAVLTRFDVSAIGCKETTMLMQKASIPILFILALLPAFLAGCGGYATTGYNPTPAVASLSPASATMIASILYGAWIGGQALYWLFLKHQTEFLGEEYWRMCLLISRNRTKTREDITRTAGNDRGNSTMSQRLYPSSHSIDPWGSRIEFVEVQ